MHYFQPPDAFYYSTGLELPQIHPKWIPKWSYECFRGVVDRFGKCKHFAFGIDTWQDDWPN
jgi:hypothetical protein